MLIRTVTLFSFGVAAVLFGAARTEAQFGKGPGAGFGKGPGPGADVQKLESDLQRLLEQVKEAQTKLARAKEPSGSGKGSFKGQGQRGFQGQGQFEGKKKGGFGGKGPGGFGGKGPDAKLDPDTIKEKYLFYKKLYEESQRGERKSWAGYKGKKKPGAAKGEYGRGPRGARSSAGSVEARIDRLIRELEQLRNEVRGGGKKKPRD